MFLCRFAKIQKKNLPWRSAMLWVRCAIAAGRAMLAAKMLVRLVAQMVTENVWAHSVRAGRPICRPIDRPKCISERPIGHPNGRLNGRPHCRAHCRTGLSTRSRPNCRPSCRPNVRPDGFQKCFFTPVKCSRRFDSGLWSLGKYAFGMDRTRFFDNTRVKWRGHSML